MKSRYFSIENVQKLNKEFAEHNTRNETKTKTSNLEVNGQESQVPRRDYLLKKLLQSRNQPSSISTTSHTCEKEESSTADEIAIAHNAFLSRKSDRKHSFQDEFIPLLDGNNNNQKPNETEQDEDDDEETESVQVSF